MHHLNLIDPKTMTIFDQLNLDRRGQKTVDWGWMGNSHPGLEQRLEVGEKEVWCLMGGLMEDPTFHWELLGRADGNTDLEVYQDLCQKDHEFAKYFCPNNHDRDPLWAGHRGPTYWGWKLEVR